MNTQLPLKFGSETGAVAVRCLCALLAAWAVRARAGGTNAPPLTPQQFFEGGTNTYNNWVEFSTGGFLTQGNPAEAAAVQHWHNGAFGGIEDLHLQGNAFTNTTFTLDGHSIFDQHNYDLKFRLAHPQLWYLQFHFNNFRTWSDDLGGYYPPTGTAYSGSGNALALDRGKFSFEAGVTPQSGPALTFKYTHSYRNGDEASTIWGPVHPEPLNSPATVRDLYPSFYGIDETVDAFDLSAKQYIKGTTYGLGLHYEHGDLNDSLNSTFYPGETIPDYQHDLTVQQDNSYDLFSANATSETWIKDNLMFSAGGLFANLDNYFSGSQIYGNSFGAAYSPAFNGFGYYGMSGGSHMQEYVMDLNLLALPKPTFTIIPALRVQKETWDAESSGTGTLDNFGTQPFTSQSTRDLIDVCESLEARYTGVTNWVFSAGGQWDETQGSLNQAGGLSQVNGFGPSAVTNFSDDSSLLQKYSVNARWYPLYLLSLNFGGYYKNEHYDLNAQGNSTPDGLTYPGYLAVQDSETYDGNFRLTWHPLSRISLTTRYEYQLSTIEVTPAAGSGYNPSESCRMISHVIGQDIGWIPWSRLSLQAGFNYVLSETKTPVSGYVLPGLSAASVLDAENNYWTLDFASDFIVDDKTDLSLNYFYYQTDDYQNNASAGVPLGSGAREHGLTATLTRRINPHLRVNLKYGYYNYEDALTGGASNFAAQTILATMQYRF